jgi:hypothetical protein
MSERLIRVQGRGSASQAPDHVALSFGLKARDSDYQEALKLLDEKHRLLQNQVNMAGVSRKELMTTRFDVSAAYVTKGKQQVFDGYVASHFLRLEIPWERERLALVLGKLSDIVDGIDFQISFFVKDSVGLRNVALAEAVKRAEENARTIAKAAGVTLGQIVSVDYGWTEFRFESEFMLSANEAMAQPDINPDAITHSETVTTAWSIPG